MHILLEFPVSLSNSVRTVFDKVLVIEDHALIALDLETILLDCGVRSVVVAPTIAHALKLIQETVFDAAFLDFKLNETTTLPLAIALREANIPFAFSTGYEAGDSIFTDFQDCAVVTKPYLASDIRQALLTLGSSSSVSRRPSEAG